MLSPIMPCIFSVYENIPTIDIFASGDNIPTPRTCWPRDEAMGASPVAEPLEQANFDLSLNTDLGKIKRERKATACETELEISVESSIDGLVNRPRKKSLLEGLEPLGGKFDRILTEDDSCEIVTEQFLGKRGNSTLNDNFHIQGRPQLNKVQSTPCTTPLLSVFKNISLDNDCRRVCDFGHRIGQNSQSKSECYLCISVLSTIERFAQEKGGHLVSTALCSEVVLSCQQGHQWSVCYKKATKSWCKECKLKRKLLLKEMIEEENSRIFEERKLKQEKLLSEAREQVKMNQETHKQDMKSELENLNIIIEEITRIASKYAREYCQKEVTADFDQTLLLYQTLILPEKVLSSFFDTLSKADLKREFRRYTIQLHPDKNCHPKAKQAFQKAYSLLSKQAESS